MAQSSIEWTESTRNSVTACSKISSGCEHRYAETIAFRLQAMGQPNYVNGFDLTLQPQMLTRPLEWKKRRLAFDEGVPFEYIQQVFDVMQRAQWHQFQILEPS